MLAKILALIVLSTSSYGIEAGILGFLRHNKAQEIDETPPYEFGDITFFGSGKILKTKISKLSYFKNFILSLLDNNKGCPQGTVQSITSSDNQTFSVIFSSYMSETSESKNMARSSCNLAVPVEVKEGFSVGIFKTDYRGFADVPDSSTKNYARFGAEYFFAGKKGPTVSRTFLSGSSEDFFISDDLLINGVVYSECGASTVFRINTSISAYKKKTDTEGDVFIGIDTIDTTIEESHNYGFHYHITQKKC